MSDPAINQLRNDLNTANMRINQVEQSLRNELFMNSNRMKALEDALRAANSKIDDLQSQINGLKRH